MADKKISELTALTGADTATDDQLVIVDTSAGLTKSITVAEFQNALDGSTGFVRITGDTMTGDLALSGADVTFGDNDKAIFGAGPELQIYSDGTSGIIKDVGSGDIKILADDFYLQNAAGNSTLISVLDTGKVGLGFAGSEKLATTSTGIDVTGTVTADGLTVDGTGTFNTNIGVVVSSATPTIRITETDTTDENTQFIQAAGTFRIRTASDDYSTTKERLRIDHGTGDISFYEDTGTTAKLYWDAADERLGIGTASPASTLHVKGRTLAVDGAAASDSPRLNLDLDGTNKASILLNRVTEDLQLTVVGSNVMTFTTNSNEAMRIDSSGNVGIGTDSPKTELNIAANNSGQGAKLTIENTDTSITTNDIIGQIDFYANDASTNGTGAKVNIKGIATSAAGSNTALTFGTSDTTSATAVERMRISSTGNVGIGTSSPSYPMTIHSTGDGIKFEISDTVDANYRIQVSGNDIITGPSTASDYIFQTGNTERMRIDSSGNLLVGTTDTAPTSDGETGFVARSSGYVLAGMNNQQVMLLNRSGTDGDILQFRKSGSSVGSIGVSSGNNLYFSSSASNHGGLIFSDGGASTPQMNPLSSGSTLSDGVMNIGSSSYRFKDLYLSGNANVGDRLLVNGATSNAQLSVLGDASLRAQNVQVAVDGHTAVGFFNASGTEVGGITVAASATAYNTSSDYRLKTDAQPITGATDRLKQLNPVNFEWIADGTRVDGFLAHEAQAVVPEAVTGAKDAMRDEEYEVTPAVADDDGNVTTEAVMGTRSVPDYQGIDQSKLVPLLVATIKELEARITALENA